MDQHKELLVELGERSYPIWIGEGLLSNLSHYLERLKVTVQQKVLVITDDHVHSIYGDQVVGQLRESGYSTYLYSVPAGERSKSLQEYEHIMTYAIKQKLDRQSLIIALGGGVVGDLAGFVASTFMRGISYIQIPTSIQAHDSSVGGKVAINHPLGKNLIGSFYQPLAVIYDTNTLRSLPRREIISGFAEVIKYAYIWDASLVDWLRAHREQCLQLKEPYLTEVLYKACKIKALVVKEDEKEQGLRAILNFGHTFGHAFESLGNYSRHTHGEAISIGMALAAKVSEEIYGHVDLMESITTLLSSFGLPVTWSDLPWDVDHIIEKMYSDKKVVAGSLTLILIKEVGRADIVKDVQQEVIKDVFLKGEKNT